MKTNRLQLLAAYCRQLKGRRQVLIVVQRFWQDEGTRNAAALTYTSLFAVVPLLMVLYSMLAALPLFRDISDELQLRLFNHLVPTTGVVVQEYLGVFAQQARQLTLIGMLVLLVTAGMMLVNIEKAFNHIWRVEKPRRGLQAFLIYWVVLTLGPLLLGAGVMFSSYLATLPLVEKLNGFTGGSVAYLWRYLPLVLSMLAFTLLYWAVPNCVVKLKDAWAGGVLMALLFEAAKKIFAWAVSSFPSYELVYGAFAAFPLFLVWMYISWVMILLCAEWVAIKGLEVTAPEQTNLAQKLEPGEQVLLILSLLWQAFTRGEGVTTSSLHASAPNQSLASWHSQLAWLQANQWAVYDSERQLWLPGKDYNSLSLAKCLQALPWRPPVASQWPEQLKDLHQLRQLLHKMQEQEAKQMDFPLGSLLLEKN